MTSTNTTEIFRHFRPLSFDHKKMAITSSKMGGISFLLKPTQPGKYVFWITACPMHVTFSIKQAAKKLRTVAEEGIIPFGMINISHDRPLLEQLIDVLTLAETVVSFNEHALLEAILKENKMAQAQWEKHIAAAKLKRLSDGYDQDR